MTKFAPIRTDVLADLLSRLPVRTIVKDMFISNAKPYIPALTMINGCLSSSADPISNQKRSTSTGNFC